MNRSIIINLERELEKLENISEIIGSAIVNRNGLLISARLPREIDERKLSALSATMFQALETASSSLRVSRIKNLTVEYEDYQIIVLGIDEKTIFVSIFDLNVNLGLNFIEIEECIKNIKKLIKE